MKYNVVPFGASESDNKLCCGRKRVSVAPYRAVYCFNTRSVGWKGYCKLTERGAGTVSADVIMKLFLII
jgi:hypothetical protein